MSTIYNIFRFAKPSASDLKDIDHFSDYKRWEVCRKEEYDESYEFIRLFQSDDPYAANLLHSKFAVPLILPRTETDYDKMHRVMGFSEEAIRQKKVHLTFGNSYHYIYTDGEEKKEIRTKDKQAFDYEVPTECFAIKMEELWDSGEAYVYPDHGLVKKYIPDMQKYYYVPVSNSILAKAELPFLIFEKNRGRCFIEEE